LTQELAPVLTVYEPDAPSRTTLPVRLRRREIVDSSKLGNWLQIGGNLGLIAGLVLVAVQINQNTEMTRAQMLSEGWINAASNYYARAGENPASAIARAHTDPDRLTHEDMIVLDAVITAEWMLANRVEVLSSMGYEVFPIEAMARVFVSQQLGNPFGMAWWKSREGIAAGAPITRDLIDEFVAESGTGSQHQQRRRLESIRAAMEIEVSER
jgi:hypothetical protein